MSRVSEYRKSNGIPRFSGNNLRVWDVAVTWGQQSRPELVEAVTSVVLAHNHFRPIDQHSPAALSEDHLAVSCERGPGELEHALQSLRLEVGPLY
jgi:hypothetical protein